MQLGGALHHHAAIVVVGRHFLSLALPRHHIRASVGIGVKAGDAALLELVVSRRPGTHEAALLLPKATDALALDQRLDEAEGIVTGGQNDLHHTRITAEHLARKALPDIHAAGHSAAAARAGAGTELGRLEDARLDLSIRELDGAGEPGITRADDHHTRRARHIGEIAGHRLVGFPPVRCRFEILVDDIALSHWGSFCSCLEVQRIIGATTQRRNHGPRPRSTESGAPRRRKTSVWLPQPIRTVGYAALARCK